VAALKCLDGRQFCNTRRAPDPPKRNHRWLAFHRLAVQLTERDLVERLASRQWLRRRALKLQKLFLAPNGLITDEKQFALYRRYETQHERAYNKALSDLLRLRALQLREQNGFESQKRKDALHAYQLQAAKDRQTRNQLAVQTAEVRLLLAQHKASLIETTVPTPADTSAVPQTQNLETPDFLTANR
jgi:hypothetical protein